MFQITPHYDTFSVYDPFMTEWMNLSHVGLMNLPTYIVGTIAIILLPGPNSLYVLTISSQTNWRSGVWGAFGIVVGDSILMTAIVLGAASFLQNSPTLFTTLRWLGALYLLWLAWGLLQTAWQRYRGFVKETMATSGQARLMQMHPFIAALGLSLTNPKAIFFFISFFTQFVDPRFSNPALSFLFLAIILQILSISYLSVLVWAGQTLVKRLAHHQRLAAALWFAVGALFIYFALRLLVSSATN